MNNAEILLVLEHERGPIVRTAVASLRHAPTHYDTAGAEETHRRIEALYDQLLAAVTTSELGGITEYARQLAAQRFLDGYDLSDVQGAMNALEEATWIRLGARLQPEQLAVPLGVVSTVLGAAKDALAREYVSLASQTHVTSLDMSALFTGNPVA